MNYIIAATGRARSGVLASYLRQLGCGKPDEFFETVRFDILRAKPTETELQDYLESQRHNGIFGMRVVWSHVRKMHEVLGIGLKEFTDTYLPNPQFVFMERCPWRQAIESAIYQAWNDIDNARIPLDQIRNRVTQIVIGNTVWGEYFKQHNITPIRLQSEDLQADPNVAKDICMELEYMPPDRELANTFNDQYMDHPKAEAWYRRITESRLRILEESL